RAGSVFHHDLLRAVRWLTAPPGRQAAAVGHAVPVGHLHEGEEPFHVIDVGGQAYRCAQRPGTGQAEKADVLIHRPDAGPCRLAPDLPGELGRALAGAGVAVAPGPDRDPGRRGIAHDRALVHDAAAGIEQVERDGAAAVAGTGGPVDPRHRLAVAVPQRGEPV